MVNSYLSIDILIIIMYKKVSDNYHVLTNIILDLIRDKKIPPNPKILDFGCGRCQLIKLLKKNIPSADLYGVDIYKDYNIYCEMKEKYHNLTILNIKPYQEFLVDEKFDLIISNQVFEHINKLELIYKFFKKIMNNSCLIIAAFPTKEIIFEPHLRIPFAHLINKDSCFLKPYLYLFNTLFELLKGNFIPQNRIKLITQKNYDFCRNNIFYLNKKEHKEKMGNFFRDIFDMSDEINFYWREGKFINNFIKLIISKIPFKSIRLSLTSRLIGSLFIIKN